MANSKRRCSYCKEYKRTEDGLLVNNRFFCNYDHAASKGKQQNEQNKAKEWRKEKKQRKEAIKTRSDYAKEAQIAVNTYIRVRDKGKPCISCDKPDNGTHQRHASHYRSVKACSILRFNTFNIWASCMVCNAHLSGNLLEYRIRLTKKLGQNKIDWLESQNDPRRYEIEYLKRLKKVFTKRKRHLERLRGY